MKISNTTFDVLRNFASINQNIVIPKGNVITTKNESKTVFAKATIGETFGEEVSIYDLGALLGVFNIFKEPEISVGEKFMDIVEGNFKQRYYYSEKERLTYPEKQPPEYDFQLTCKLSKDQISTLLKASSILSLTHIKVQTGNGTVKFTAYDPKAGKQSNYFDVDVSVDDVVETETVYTISVELLNIILDDYEFSFVLTKNGGCSLIRNQNRSLEYFVVLDTKYSTP
jgi:hypothetical protein